MNAFTSCQDASGASWFDTSVDSSAPSQRHRGVSASSCAKSRYLAAISIPARRWASPITTPESPHPGQQLATVLKFDGLAEFLELFVRSSDQARRRRL